MHNAEMFRNTRSIDYKLLTITSDAFGANGDIPVKHTCEGVDVNPALHIEGFPEGAKTIAIVLDDPDAPNGSFCHWVVWNIPVTHQIKEKEQRGCTGMNDFHRHRYNGPCPPFSFHRYLFKVYALDCVLNLPVSSGKPQLEKAMSDHVLGFGVLAGKCRKVNSSYR